MISKQQRDVLEKMRAKKVAAAQMFADLISDGLSEEQRQAHQLMVTYWREAPMYVLADCTEGARLLAEAGIPYVFDAEDSKE